MYCQKDAANSSKHILLNLNCKKNIVQIDIKQQRQTPLGADRRFSKKV